MNLRYCMVTIHIDGQYWHPHFVDWSVTGLSYLTGQLEQGETSGALHWQLYGEAVRPISLSKWKESLMCPWAHIEPRFGSVSKALEYVHKSTTRVHGPETDFTYGTATESTRERNTLSESPYKRALTSENVGQALDILREQAPRDFVVYFPSIKRNLKMIFEQPPKPTRLDPNNFCIPLLEPASLLKTVILSGASGIGKTQYALAHFENPLFITHIDDLRKLDQQHFDGLVFDDMSFAHWPASSCIHLVDIDQPRTINVKYGTVTIAPGTRRIFTTNLDLQSLFSKEASDEERKAIERRVLYLTFQDNLFSIS